MSLSLHGGQPRSRRADSLSLGGGSLREPINGLKDKLIGLQPKIDAARYKAEAGLSRRGFVSHHGHGPFHEESEERLVHDDLTGESSAGGDSALDDEDGFGHDADHPTVDRDFLADSDEERRAGRYKRPWEVERDEMKWPVAPGEGWKPL